MNHNEKMNAVETGVVSVSKDQAVLERSEAHGTYRVRNIGPLEQYRDEYVALRDRINAKGFRAFLDKLLGHRTPRQRSAGQLPNLSGRQRLEFVVAPHLTPQASAALAVVQEIGRAHV